MKWKKRAIVTAWTGLFFLVPSLNCTESLFSSDLPVDINFSQNSHYGQFITGRELEIWGMSRNLALLPDCPARNLQDFEAELILPRGMVFHLLAPGEGRIFLYLDLVTFLPANRYDPYKKDEYCNSGADERSYSDRATRSLLPEVHWLEVRVNGHHMKTLYMGGGAFLASPVVIVIDREHAFRRTLEVELLPSPGDPVFGIWDVYVSRYRDRDGRNDSAVK